MQFPLDRPLPRVSSPFGWRIHPIEKIRKHHNGVDWAGRIGQPVYAIADGRVVFAGPSRFKFSNGEPAGGGYIVRVRHKLNGKWITSSYMHLKKGSIVVKKGERVAEGAVLGQLGNSGESTGPHLHFEIQRGNTYVWTSNGSRYEEPVSFIKTQMALERAKK